jgi:hypothetical protein
VSSQAVGYWEVPHHGVEDRLSVCYYLYARGNPGGDIIGTKFVAGGVWGETVEELKTQYLEPLVACGAKWTRRPMAISNGVAVTVLDGPGGSC